MIPHSQPRRENDFTHAIIETMIDGVALCHGIEEAPLARFTIWNRAMEELTGYTIAEINRLGWYQTVYSDTAVQKRARLRMEHTPGRGS
jgi:PAS domain-containing protein